MQMEDVKEEEDGRKDPSPAYPNDLPNKEPMDGLSQKEKDLMDEMKGLQWSEFTQNTTFHGVKYIFEETPIRFRRYLDIDVCSIFVLTLFYNSVNQSSFVSRYRL